jgi:hypothetical protein
VRAASLRSVAPTVFFSVGAKNAGGNQVIE